jgi:replicative DNA helicase
MMALSDRVPPNSKENEEALLSAIFINNEVIDDIEDLEPNDFYYGAHKTIFTGMTHLFKNRSPVDLVTLAKHLRDKKKLTKVGGAAYLARISDSAPVALNAKFYAKNIKSQSLIRQVMNTAVKIFEQGYQVEDTETYLSESQSKILNIQTTNSKDVFYDMPSLMNETLERIEKAQVKKEDLNLDIGLPTIGHLLQIFGSRLVIIAGRPGMGKTALALSMAKYLAEHGTKIGFLSIEMDKETLADRVLSIESDINVLKFYKRKKLETEETERLMIGAEFLSNLPILIDDAECNIEDVKRKCRKLKKQGCRVIFIDQLSKIRGEVKDEQYTQYTKNCNEIALMKKELRLPIFLLSQLNRKVEDRNNKTPTLSDLKQTGALEEDADAVFLLYRPGYYDREIDGSKTQIILAKNRHGGTGVENQVVFKEKRGMFKLGKL